MKNKLILLSALFMLFVCLTNCFQQHSLKIISDDYCDSCNKWSGYYFYHRYYLEGKENCLDSALFLINEALSRCEEKRYDMSIRKLAVLCGKQEYDEAIMFMDSINFAGHDYSCYETIIRKRIYAMKYQSVEDIHERNRYLQEIIDILDNYLVQNSNIVDSVWKNMDWRYDDSIVLATTQYYYYLSILKGGKFTYSKLDTLFNNGRINQTGLEILQNACASRGEFMLFKGI